MIDIIIAFLAAEGLPALVLLCRARQTGLSGDAGVIAALSSLGQGSVLAGLGCLLLVQLLAIGLAVASTLLFFRWKYRKVTYSTKGLAEALDKISSLPVSPIMRKMLSRQVCVEYKRRVRAYVAEMRKKDDQQ